MTRAFRHTSGAIHLSADGEGYAPPDWEDLGELPADVPAEYAVEQNGAIVADLERARNDKIAVLRDRRNQEQDAGCDTPLGLMQSDPASRGLLNGAVTGALVAQAAGQTFSIGWTMADNSIVEHDAPAIIAAGMAVMTHVQQQHAIYETLRAAVQAATDLAAIDAVQWPET